MRISISNIAWDTAEDDAVVELLREFAVDAIDIAPGKYFENPAATGEAEIERVRMWWHSRGIALTGMQALLFGTSGLNMFGVEASRQAMLDRLAAVARIGGLLGSSRLVFGSPKNRDRSLLNDQQAFEIAVPFFRQLGDIAAAQNVVFCLEPNPVCYGANFMTTSAETAEIVRRADHPAIRMQFDTGALAINGESPGEVLANYSDLIGHVHASEPQLVPLGDGTTDHAAMGEALAKYLPDSTVAIEMVATSGQPHLQSIRRALETVHRWYRRAPEGTAA